MPKRDGTGPQGKGTGAGRGLGKCANKASNANQGNETDNMLFGPRGGGQRGTGRRRRNMNQ